MFSAVGDPFSGARGSTEHRQSFFIDPVASGSMGSVTESEIIEITSLSSNGVATPTGETTQI